MIALSVSKISALDSFCDEGEEELGILVVGLCNTHSTVPQWSPFGVPETPGDSFGDLGPLWVPIVCFGSGPLFSILDYECKRTAACILFRPFNISKVYVSQLYVILLLFQNNVFCLWNFALIRFPGNFYILALCERFWKIRILGPLLRSLGPLFAQNWVPFLGFLGPLYILKQMCCRPHTNRVRHSYELYCSQVTYSGVTLSTPG